MNYYKVVDPFLVKPLIDTHEVNYSVTLDNWDWYSNLLTLVTESSGALGLPLDFLLTLHNQLAIHKNSYLESIPRSANGIYPLAHLLPGTFCDRRGLIKENDLIHLVRAFDSLGLFVFVEAYYLWEWIFEQVRQDRYPNLPSRRDCFFLFGSAEDCQYYMQQHMIEGVIRQVTLLETRSLFQADMGILDDLPPSSTSEQAKAFADRYWSGQRCDRPVLEYLFQGICRLD